MDSYKKWLTVFGSRLRLERERQKLTRLALANMVNTSQNYIMQIERGDKSPSLKTFLNILSALNIPANSLIHGAIFDDSVEREKILDDVTNFLAKQSYDDLTSFYEILVFLSKYIKMPIIHQ